MNFNKLKPTDKIQLAYTGDGDDNGPWTGKPMTKEAFIKKQLKGRSLTEYMHQEHSDDGTMIIHIKGDKVVAIEGYTNDSEGDDNW